MRDLSSSESQRQPRRQALEMVSPPRTRSESAASDRTSVFRFSSLPSSPMSRRPDPAYIAVSAASQIVTNDQDPQSFDLGPTDSIPAPSAEPALVTPAALKLVNFFLDQLLLDVLSVARSTSLAALRPAVAEILRPTLAREAIAGADQELDEYLGRGVDEPPHWEREDPDLTAGWDLDAAWRQARLRCMIYSSLGDMEGEDEELFAAEDQRPGSRDDGPSGNDDPDLVSPAVAIFLTSILEFIGEQVLILAGQAAVQRVLARKREANMSDRAAPWADGPERLIVDELDTEKVALNPTFGRLWRAWRKRLRSSTSFPRSMSRESNVSRHRQLSHASSSRRPSVETPDAPNATHDHSPSKSLTEVPEEDVAAGIALPMSDNDVEEIEVPGVADREGAMSGRASSEDLQARRRPRSLTTPHVTFGGQSIVSAQNIPSRPHPSRTRSQSQPASKPAPLGFSSKLALTESTLATPVPPSDLDAASDSTEYDRQELSDAMKQDLESRSTMPVMTPAGGFNTRLMQNVVSQQGGDVPRQPPNQLSNNGEPPGFSPHARNDIESDTRSSRASPGPSNERTSNYDREDIQDTGDGRVLDENLSQSMTAAPATAKSRRQSDEPSASPTDSAEMHNQPAVADVNANHQSTDIELNVDPAAIGVAQTSNVPVFAPNSSLFNRPTASVSGTKVQRQQQQLPTSPPGSRLHDHGVPKQTSVDGVDDRDGADLEPPARHPSRESTKLTYSPNGSEAVNNATKRISTPTQRHVVLAPSSLALSTGSSSVSYSREALEDGTKMSGQEASPEHDQVGQKYQYHPSSGSVLNGHPAESESASSSSASLPRQLSISGRKADPKPLNSPLSKGLPADRASVQRLYTPAFPAREASNPSSSRSDSFGRGGQPNHSSGPSSPQLPQKYQNLVLRPYEENEAPTRPDRVADETSSGGIGRKPSQMVKPRGPEKSFEQLIESGETIQYTLTPPSMREMEETPRRTTTTELTGSFKKTGSVKHPSRPHDSRPLKTNPLVERQSSPSTLQSPTTDSPTSATARSPTIPLSDGKGTNSVRSVSGSLAPSSRSRAAGAIARDGRAEWGLTRDFVEFIRTGPDPETEARSADTSARLASVPVRDSASVQDTLSPSLSLKTKPKPRLQAREATGSRRENSSALADFIREGPPNDGNRPNESLAEIAPFAAPLHSHPTSLGAGARTSTLMSPPTTISTRTGLSPPQPQSVASSLTSPTALPSSRVGAARLDLPPSVPRKQHRAKDMYAIDTDSEDEAERKPTVKPGREESLMDFLRNVPPPPAQTTLPSAFDDVPKPGSKLLSKGGETSGTARSRFGRGDSSWKPSGKSVVKNSKADPALPFGASRVSSEPPQLSLQSHHHDALPFDTTDTLRVAARSIVGSTSSASGSVRSAYPSTGDSERRPLVSGGHPAAALRVDPRRPGDYVGTPKPVESLPSATSRSPPPPPAKEQSGLSRIMRKIKPTGVA